LAAHPPWQVKGKPSSPDQKNHKVDKLPVIIKIHTEKVHQFELAVGRMVNSKEMFIKHKKKSSMNKSKKSCTDRISNLEKGSCLLPLKKLSAMDGG